MSSQGVPRVRFTWCRRARYGAEAYGFWESAWLTHDPYRFGWHAHIPQTHQPCQSYWIRYPNGDGFLLYPGESISTLTGA
jgi:hypothetical protein